VSKSNVFLGFEILCHHSIDSKNMFHLWVVCIDGSLDKLGSPNLSALNLVTKTESFLTFMYNYFAHSLKCHLEVGKLVWIARMQRKQALKNINTQWISMLSPSNRVSLDYKILIVRMVQNNATITNEKFN
jgi:hypothetical protein